MNISFPTEDYRVRFWKRDSGFVFVIDELNLVAFGDDLVSAYDALMAEKERLTERAERAGIELPGSDSRYTEGGTPARAAKNRDSLWATALRAGVGSCTVLAIIGVLAIGGLWSAGHAVESRGGMLKIVRGAITLAATHSRSLSEEARAEIRGDLRAIIVNASSLVDDLEPAGSGKAPAQKPALRD